MGFLTEIQHHIRKSNIIEKLIYVNLLVFIVVLFFKSLMVYYFSLPANLSELTDRPWTVVTYGFIHTRFLHILSNILILYYIGNLFLDFFSEKKALLYYSLGLLLGGAFFLIYSVYTKSPSSLLIGASAAVTSIFIGLASKVPRYALKLRFVGSVELWVLAAIWFILNVFGSVGVNAGSSMAHLGGALTGYFLTTFFNEGSFLFNLFPKRNKEKKTPFKHVYRKENSNYKRKPSNAKKKQDQRKVDAILDKISKSGYDALSQKEKDFLFNQKEEN